MKLLSPEPGANPARKLRGGGDFGIIWQSSLIITGSLL